MNKVALRAAGGGAERGARRGVEPHGAEAAAAVLAVAATSGVRRAPGVGGRAAAGGRGGDVGGVAPASWRQRPEPASPGLPALVAAGQPLPLVVLRRATPEDSDAVHALLETWVALGLVLPRTRAQVGAMIGDFLVAWDGAEIVGCAALKLYSPLYAEIGGLAVAAHWQGQGVGRLLVEALVAEAVASDMTRVFALTLQEGFFHKLGFRTTVISEFPEKIARDCSGCARRNACVEIAVVRDLAVVDDGSTGREE